MKKIAAIFIVLLLFIGYNCAAQGKNEDYKIIVNCPKTTPKVYVILIGKAYYIFDSQNIGEAISQSKIDPDNIQNIKIFKEGNTDQWKKAISILKEFNGRISSVSEVVMKGSAK